MSIITFLLSNYTEIMLVVLLIGSYISVARIPLVKRKPLTGHDLVWRGLVLEWQRKGKWIYADKYSVYYSDED